MIDGAYMDACNIIRKKRFGQELTDDEIRFFVQGVVNGRFADYQTAAMLMAICINGMTDRETLALTKQMARSGETLRWERVPGIKADKHSTGGVGDSTTLVLVPLVASCGVQMAKMSGRGLGFTGGTLDKMESIPGMNVHLSAQEFERQVVQIGCAVTGQTAQLAPADKALYALRDVTATVDCMPLVASSILSKKLAAGCDVVVLDVKSGSGAIMETKERSRELAQMMVRIGNLSGKRFSALITNMDQPLGNCVGNALEVEEAIEILSGRIEGDLKEVSLQLGAHILVGAGKASCAEDGMRILEEKIRSGEGLDKLAQMIAAQGGDARVVRDLSLLPRARKQIDIRANCDGWLARTQTDQIGNAARLLGAGRMKKDDAIDPSVGIVMKKRIGDRVQVGDVLATMHVAEASEADAARKLLEGALMIGKEPVGKPKLIEAVIE